jgi:ribosomal protein S27E
MTTADVIYCSDCRTATIVPTPAGPVEVCPMCGSDREVTVFPNGASVADDRV